MNKVIPAALSIACVAGPVGAGYLGDKAAWDRLPDQAKAVYAMGVYDASNILFDDDSKDADAVKRARVRCLADGRLLPPQLLSLVEAAYAKEAAAAARAPSQVIIAAVGAHCARHIGEERQKAGVPPGK